MKKQNDEKTPIQKKLKFNKLDKTNAIKINKFININISVINVNQSPTSKPNEIKPLSSTDQTAYSTLNWNHHVSMI
ncbi:hypothetical Protein YC6258_03210 [Gynuella sunshinyii YC6258]|uniref:Uncharacterized protein n=1 Tax=Gynuella sunshinyii YC6258 TaxID=1445510 RepID=A0A0C5VLV4_9GAMM|nr:hypothetical Protein YC6258_03210 [Gynuella sunshinyii YC6258]